MNLFGDAIAWIFSGPEQGTAVPTIGSALGIHLFYTFVSLAVAAVIAIPAGWAIGHTGKGRDVAVAISGAARAIPSFGLLLLLVLLFGVLQIPAAAVVTFVLLGIPSILAGAYSGFEAVNRSVIDAGRSVGMTEWQILWKIEVPLGLPLLVAGLRAAALQIVATVTIAAIVNLGGLGAYIIYGIPLSRIDIVLAGALLVAVLALLLDGVFALLQHLSVPRGVRQRRSTRRRPRAESSTTPDPSPAAREDSLASAGAS